MLRFHHRALGAKCGEKEGDTSVRRLALAPVSTWCSDFKHKSRSRLVLVIYDQVTRQRAMSLELAALVRDDPVHGARAGLVHALIYTPHGVWRLVPLFLVPALRHMWEKVDVIWVGSTGAQRDVSWRRSKPMQTPAKGGLNCKTRAWWKN